MTIQELNTKMQGFSKTYHMVNIREDRDFVYSIPEEELFLPQNLSCLVVKVLNLQYEGRLEEADRLINSLPENDFMRLGLTIVNPTVTWKQFIDTLKYLEGRNITLQSIILTAGRPSLLNGFNDFSRIGFSLPRRRDVFVRFLSCIYPKEDVPHLYDLCLAEYYYQINKLVDAEVLVTKTIFEFEKKNDLRILFVALSLQAKILLANGTESKTGNFVKEIRQRVREKGIAEFYYNIDAVEVNNALFKGDYALINNWMNNNAPDEYGNFNMLDLYRYMIKMRCYLVNENSAAVIALAEKLRPLLETGRRHIDLCEIDMLEAIAFYSAQKKEEAFAALERALKLAKRRQYYRLIADEGARILEVLIDYIKEKGSSEFLMMIVGMTREMAIKYPLYLKPRYINNKEFTKMEIDILNLLQQGKSKEEIADYFFISVNTVKYHLKKIYSKLGANTPHHVVWHARLLGLIN